MMLKDCDGWLVYDQEKHVATPLKKRQSMPSQAKTNCNDSFKPMRLVRRSLSCAMLARLPVHL